MENCTCDKLNCDNSCLCACHGDKTEHELDLIKFDEGLKELVPEIFPELKELNKGLDRIDEAVDLCIERMQKYDLKKTRSCNICDGAVGNNQLQLCDKCLLFKN